MPSPPSSSLAPRIIGIAASDPSPQVEVVRGRLDHRRSDELLAFWLERRALSGLEARRRLPEVVCALRLDGGLVGTSSAYAANLPLLGGRRFWMYRSVIDPAVTDQSPAMIRATFAALEAEFDGSAAAPIGLCHLAGEEERRRRPQAEWPEPRMLYAGYLHDGRQVRIAYFDGARVA